MPLFGRRKVRPAPGNTTAVVLAGGAASRFGAQKGLALLDGRPLVSWVTTAAGAAARETLLVLPPGEPHEPWQEAVGARATAATLGFVHDDERFAGPVAGLRAAAPRVGTPFVLLLAVDMPLVPPDLLLGLMQRLSGHDAVAFHLDGWWRPLPSVWRTRSLMEALDLAEQQAVTSLHGLLDLLDTRPLGREFLGLFSSDGWELNGINTVEDLAETSARLAERRASGND